MANIFLVSLERVKRRIRTLMLRAIVQSVNDSSSIQLIQVKGLADEVLDKVERLQNYGMTSNPPAGSEAFVAFVGADRSAGVILAIENRTFRIKSLKPGEVCIYTDEGDYIKFLRNRKIDFHSGSTITIEAPNVIEKSTTHKIETSSFQLATQSFSVFASGESVIDTENLQVTGDVLDQCNGSGKSMSSMRETYNTHTHKETNSEGGSTLVPNEAM